MIYGMGSAKTDQMAVATSSMALSTASTFIPALIPVSMAFDATVGVVGALSGKQKAERAARKAAAAAVAGAGAELITRQFDAAYAVGDIAGMQAAIARLHGQWQANEESETETFFSLAYLPADQVAATRNTWQGLLAADRRALLAAETEARAEQIGTEAEIIARSIQIGLLERQTTTSVVRDALGFAPEAGRSSYVPLFVVLGGALLLGILGGLR